MLLHTHNPSTLEVKADVLWVWANLDTILRHWMRKENMTKVCFSLGSNLGKYCPELWKWSQTATEQVIRRAAYNTVPWNMAPDRSEGPTNFWMSGSKGQDRTQDTLDPRWVPFLMPAHPPESGLRCWPCSHTRARGTKCLLFNFLIRSLLCHMTFRFSLASWFSFFFFFFLPWWAFYHYLKKWMKLM
jgi:hypothetical protein